MPIKICKLIQIGWLSNNIGDVCDVRKKFRKADTCHIRLFIYQGRLQF